MRKDTDNSNLYNKVANSDSRRNSVSKNQKQNNQQQEDPDNVNATPSILIKG